MRVVAVPAGKQGQGYINTIVQLATRFRSRLIVMAGCCGCHKEDTLLSDVIVSDIAFDPSEGENTLIYKSDGTPEGGTHDDLDTALALSIEALKPEVQRRYLQIEADLLLKDLTARALLLPS